MRRSNRSSRLPVRQRRSSTPNQHIPLKATTDYYDVFLNLFAGFNFFVDVFWRGVNFVLDMMVFLASLFA